MKNKVALITGITGQDGSYLAELLLAKGYIVHGFKRRSSSFNTTRLDSFYNEPEIHEKRMCLHFSDMTDSLSLFNLVRRIRPDEIYNLAAQSHVQVSFETPEYTANADAIGPLRLLEAVRELNSEYPVKFYQAGTSEMFGKLQSEEMLSESTPFHPQSPYGCSKLFAHWMTVNYREAYGIFASNGILFNHESPRRGETFVTRKIIRGIEGIISGKQDCLSLGNINAVRDWGHAKDYTEGMWRILQHSEPDDFVLATGVAVTVREFVARSFEKCGVLVEFVNSGLDETAVIRDVIDSSWAEKAGISLNLKHLINRTVVQINPAYFRPLEVEFLLGDASKAKEKLGWEATYSLDALIEDMLYSELYNDL